MLRVLAILDSTEAQEPLLDVVNSVDLFQGWAVDFLW